MRGRIMISVLLVPLFSVMACGGLHRKQESWDSYYYGSGYHQQSGDNDSNYIPPASGSIDPVMPVPSANMRGR